MAIIRLDSEDILNAIKEYVENTFTLFPEIADIEIFSFDFNLETLAANINITDESR